jgi:endonuclease-8
LGPDVLGTDWDPGEATRRLRLGPSTVGAALLDQRNLAGVGTLYASETLFLASLNPWTPAADLDEATVRRVVDRAHTLLDVGRRHAIQTTTGSTRWGETAWVHGRSGRPCRSCGELVRVAMVGEAPRERTMFYCPRCQGGLAPNDDGRPQSPLGTNARTGPALSDRSRRR